jgi:hypothetical protein
MMREQAASDWPYDDADRDDPLAQLRIPVTDSSPHRGYLAAFAGRTGLLHDLAPGEMRPDDSEAALLASYIGYLRSKYSQWVADRMLAAPLDVGDRAPVVFAKRGDSDWVYRRSHWRMGPFWVPLPETMEDGQKLSLPQLLDSIETWTAGNCNPAWEAWKSAHPSVFAQEIQ